MQQPGGLQQASSPTAPGGRAGAGRRLLASGPQTLAIYVAPRTGQVGCTDTWREVHISLCISCTFPFEDFRVWERAPISQLDLVLFS